MDDHNNLHTRLEALVATWRKSAARTKAESFLSPYAVDQNRKDALAASMLYCAQQLEEELAK